MRLNPLLGLYRKEIARFNAQPGQWYAIYHLESPRTLKEQPTQ